MFCSNCGNIDIEVLGNQRKAVGSSLLAGGIGFLADFAGGKGNYKAFCKKCGYRGKQNKKTNV